MTLKKHSHITQMMWDIATIYKLMLCTDKKLTIANAKIY